MTREEVFAYVKQEYGTEPDYPWEKDFESAVIRHQYSKKWYALVMNVRADKLGCHGMDLLPVVTVKADPLLIDMLTQQKGFHRAYHMNKMQWLTIELGDQIADAEIKNLIDHSYELTQKKN